MQAESVSGLILFLFSKRSPFQYEGIKSDSLKVGLKAIIFLESLITLIKAAIYIII